MLVPHQKIMSNYHAHGHYLFACSVTVADPHPRSIYGMALPIQQKQLPAASMDASVPAVPGCLLPAVPGCLLATFFYLTGDFLPFEKAGSTADVHAGAGRQHNRCDSDVWLGH